VHPISLSQLSELSPVARTKIKSRITKQHHNKAVRHETKVALFSEESTNKLPKGKLNGVSCEMILDGGYTSVVSLQAAKKLSIQHIDVCNSPVMFGDGKLYNPTGIAKDLRLQIGDSEAISANALCFDVGNRYSFIVGREGLHTLRIGPDWSNHYWYVKSEQGVIPLDVYYTKNILRKDIDIDEEEDDEDYIHQDDHEEGYLILPIDSDAEEDVCNATEEIRLGNLFTQIESQTNINEQGKRELIRLIEKYKNCLSISCLL
jgi:hypothetical protein